MTGGRCGNYKKEGDCFNREHSWPKSWFGGMDNGYGAESDLFELYPTDGYVNGMRGNYPLGTVVKDRASYVSTNGCMVGPCASEAAAAAGYTDPCFEVTDALKGDFARSYFYLSVAYWGIWTCCDDVAVNVTDIKPWMEAEMRQWHAADPPDDLERNRNDAIFFLFQRNRNPFIDFPELVDSIYDF